MPNWLRIWLANALNRVDDNRLELSKRRLESADDRIKELQGEITTLRMRNEALTKQIDLIVEQHTTFMALLEMQQKAFGAYGDAALGISPRPSE